MPEELSPSEGEENFDVAIEVPLEELDQRFFGYYTATALGPREPGRPSLVGADVQINQSILDSIVTNAERLGEDGGKLHTIKLKKKARATVPMPKEILPLEKRKLLFSGVEATLDNVKKQFAEYVGNPEEFIEESNENALEKIRKIHAVVDHDFSQQVAWMVKHILQHKDEATLFASLEQYSEETYDHGLRAFMAGIKLFSKMFGLSPERMQRNRRAMNYAYGLLFMDIGFLFVPESIINKYLRIDMEDFIEIGQKFKERRLDERHLKILYLINDPQRNFSKHEAALLSAELKKMSYLMYEGVLTEEQYSAACQFPSWSCLSQKQKQVMNHHTVWGYEVVKSSNFSSAQALDIIRHHHERLDKSGYPDGIGNMSDEAQVAAIVDIFDAMVSDRPHKPPRPYDIAFEVIEKMTMSEENRPAKLGRRFYDLLCSNIQKYPVGSFLRVEGGRYDGYVGQVREYTPGEYTMNKPEFILFRDNEGMRLKNCLLFKRKHYDGTFRIRGLPFTKKESQSLSGNQ